MRVIDLLDRPAEDPHRGQPVHRLDGDIVFDGVSHRYHDGRVASVNRHSSRIQPLGTPSRGTLATAPTPHACTTDRLPRAIGSPSVSRVTS